MSIIIEWLFPKKCYGCGKRGKYLCEECEEIDGSLQKIKGYEGVVSALKYNGGAKKLIESVKYEFVSGAIEELSETMSEKLRKNYPNVLKYWQEEEYVILPVPLYWQKENWRGFNQSHELAKRVGKDLGLKVDSKILFRVKSAKVQAQIKDRRKRRANVESVFAVDGKQKIPEKIIVFDDVVTSGSTLEAIQKVLKRSPNQCWGLTLAQARR